MTEVEWPQISNPAGRTAYKLKCSLRGRFFGIMESHLVQMTNKDGGPPRPRWQRQPSGNEDVCLAGGWGATAHKTKMKPRKADVFGSWLIQMANQEGGNAIMENSFGGPSSRIKNQSDLHFQRCILLHTVTYYDVVPSTATYYDVL